MDKHPICKGVSVSEDTATFQRKLAKAICPAEILQVNYGVNQEFPLFLFSLPNDIIDA
jgi:hypothetical protein